MSNTPRTDAEAFIIKSGESRTQYQDGEYVRAAISRQLERENALIFQLLNGHRNQNESYEELLALALEYDECKPLFADSLEEANSPSAKGIVKEQT